MTNSANSVTAPDPDGIIAAIAALSSANPIAQLSLAAAARDEMAHCADVVLDHFVERAREAGHSWSDVGTALGVTKQAAQQRYSAPDSVARRLLGKLRVGRSGQRRSLYVRFGGDSRSTVVRALEEASALGHTHIGPEHLLLAALGADLGPVRPALEVLGVTAENVRARLAAIAPATASPNRYNVPFSKSARKVLELSLREAIHIGHTDIAPVHVLLAITRADDDLTAQLVEGAAGGLSGVRDAVLAAVEA